MEARTHGQTVTRTHARTQRHNYNTYTLNLFNLLFIISIIYLFIPIYTYYSPFIRKKVAETHHHHHHHHHQPTTVHCWT
jgi:hypothetical protein